MGRAADGFPYRGAETRRGGVNPALGGAAGMSAAARPFRYDPGELAVDRQIHLAGLMLGCVGTVTLLGIAARTGAPLVFLTALIYAASLLAMLICSARYHLALVADRQAFWRRLDHAAIFLLIAGTYTPFTVCRLHGMWAVGLTAAVWIGALAGAAAKLTGTVRSSAFSTAAYIALGWVAVVGIRPILDAVDPLSLILIGVGGVVYSIGAGVHHWRSLRFHNAIWHAMVLTAACCHFAAVLHGVVLAVI
jgi:hemolysin III